MRRVTSLTALISFMLMLLTSVILYIVPHGRVAYWSDWRLWGLSKTQWADLHINLGILFLLAVFLHIYYNWRPLTAYLKNRAKQMVVMTRDFNIAILITMVVALGTYVMVPPFSSVLNLAESIKDAAIQKYGEPPFGHAELAPLATLAKKTGLDPKASLAALKAAGIRFDSPQQITLDVAKANGMTPKALYAAMSKDATSAQTAGMPEVPPPGSGNKTLALLCDEYGLDAEELITDLRAKGLHIDRDQKLKDSAVKNDISPIALYDLIRSLAKPER